MSPWPLIGQPLSRTGTTFGGVQGTRYFGKMKELFKYSGLAIAAAGLLVGCDNERGVPGRDDRVETGRGTPGATPNQQFTVTNSSQGTMIPREGGNLDRGVSRDNNPAANAPGPRGTALDQQGTGRE